MAASTIDDVATYLIQQSCGIGITHRELQKILYYSQGFYFSQFNEPLFVEDFDAWKFGPVNGRIWERFKRFGYNQLGVSSDAAAISLDDKKRAFLTSILGVFLVLGQSKLIDMSHTDYTWESNYIPGVNKQIPKDQIKEFFSNFESLDAYVQIASQKNEFSKLIDSREKYLKQLPDLGEDWISGGATPPLEDVCSECIKFLHNFRKTYSLNTQNQLSPS